MPNLHYHRPSVSDLPILARMNKDLIEDEGSHNPMTVTQLEDRIRDWLESGDYDAILFEYNAAVVAYALFQQKPESIYLRQFFVDRDFRRRGIGQSAIYMLMNDIFPPGLRITLDVLSKNPAGWTFWRRVGFHNFAVTLEAETGRE
jgi:ribosomal protein S18 acetylase RimI-like enzyme